MRTLGVLGWILGCAVMVSGCVAVSEPVRTSVVTRPSYGPSHSAQRPVVHETPQAPSRPVVTPGTARPVNSSRPSTSVQQSRPGDGRPSFAEQPCTRASDCPNGQRCVMSRGNRTGTCQR